MVAHIRALQTRLGVPSDGLFGPITFAALLRKMGASPAMAEALAAAAPDLVRAGIADTPLRLAHFMGQLAHESARFTRLEEIASGMAYEGRVDLGNTQAGDGQRFKGRGPLQITGRANYAHFGKVLGLDLVGNPALAARPAIGMAIAVAYWTDRHLNGFADQNDARAVTRRINGGFNGLVDRLAQTAKAWRLVG